MYIHQKPAEGDKPCGTGVTDGPVEEELALSPSLNSKCCLGRSLRKRLFRGFVPSVRPAPILVSQRHIWNQDFYTDPILNTLPRNFHYKVCNKQIENFFNTCKIMLISTVGFLVILHPQTTCETPSFFGGVCEFEVCNCIFLYVCAHL